VLTHGVTTTNCMGVHPMPRFRASLGATRAWFGSALAFVGLLGLLGAHRADRCTSFRR
jgi:hypothetical protein